MGFKCGIVGLPNVGKSTLFNALTQTAAAQAANYPFCTIEPNVGEVAVPEPRLEKLAAVGGSKEIIPARMNFVDIAGLVEGASQGEGLGNKFLANIRESDAICQVVRVFTDPDVIHVDDRVDAASDIETISTELILADLQTLANTRRPSADFLAKLEEIERKEKVDLELQAKWGMDVFTLTSALSAISPEPVGRAPRPPSPQTYRPGGSGGRPPPVDTPSDDGKFTTLGAAAADAGHSGPETSGSSAPRSAVKLGLNLSALKPAVVEGNRPDDAGRAPPTPAHEVVARLEAAKLGLPTSAAVSAGAVLAAPP